MKEHISNGVKNQIYTGVFVVVIMGFILYLGLTSDAPKKQISIYSDSFLSVGENNFDFGEILLRGGDVTHKFRVFNEGADILVINKIYTSCMCTEAVIENDGERFGSFGMQGHDGVPAKTYIEIAPGQMIVVEAIFDPFAHGPSGVGKIKRDIYLETNSKKEPVVVIKFEGEVVREISSVLGASLFIPTKEYDFGVIKQSGGIVEKTFDVINNGSEKIIVDSLPTSCACTTAEIDKKIIASGDRATITVFFDPNLHDEPEGRFFKTIEIVSNLEANPELKIYAEIDLDLGPEYYKLKEPHDD